jgi:ribosomal protein S1
MAISCPEDIVKEGDEVEVKVLEINRQKKQIRLSMKAVECQTRGRSPGGSEPPRKEG